ncbi:RNA polymerase-binding transcription factor DksA [Candidatus Fokinia solitaria]|uniref:RNA polymerase-binding transcription factor DksA n=1 Tax=Candidatus Fokinia solitaria TaxID=1802984 RepID=A0A2U8BSQ5_9RICK|nr:TraR/DksA C4-type zinc finger protein [Candidatus Fokinia solitaria]AWD33353.1 RNA polymerase-binding transcription factor DksA [Candidatus Fokinia solitaria]
MLSHTEIMKYASSLKGEDYMNEIQIAFFKKVLLKLKEDALSQRSDNFLQNRISNSCTVITASNSLIAEINLALDRINDKSYGYCCKSGQEIGLERLLANPLATLTIEEQEKAEKSPKNNVKHYTAVQFSHALHEVEEE